MLSRTRLLAPLAVAATMAASLVFVAAPSANADAICTTPPSVSVSDSQSTNRLETTSKAAIRAKSCDNGVEVARHPGGVSAAAAQAKSRFSFAYVQSHNSKCLNSNSKHDAVISKCTYLGRQKFHRGAEIGTTSYYQFINASGQCLGVAGNSRHKGAQVIVTACNKRNTSQFWHVDFTSSQSYLCYVFNRHSGYVLEPTSAKEGAKVKQQAWLSTNKGQQWVFVSDSD